MGLPIFQSLRFLNALDTLLFLGKTWIEVCFGFDDLVGHRKVAFGSNWLKNKQDGEDRRVKASFSLRNRTK